MTIITVSLANLQVSDFNVRTNEQDANETRALEASIRHHGLLLPLVVHPLGDGSYGVLAGGRRLHAMQALRDRGDLPVDHPVDVVIRDIPEAAIRELSLAENLLRRELRHYEVYAAYARAARDGATVEHLCERFGQTDVYVRKVLRLGNLAEPVFAAYARDELTDEQVQAYAATEDHALQLTVWRLLRGQPSHNHTPHYIRSRMKVGDRDQAKLLAFVGLANYEAAGGHFERDLFQAAAGVGRVADEELLARLVHEKLEKIRAQITATANVPITFQPEPPKTAGPFPAIDHALQVFPNRARLSADKKTRRDEINVRIAELVAEATPHVADQKALPGHEDEIARINAEHDPLEAELKEIEDGRTLVLPRVGDIVSTIKIRDDGQTEVSFWFANRKEKKRHDSRTPNARDAEESTTPDAEIPKNDAALGDRVSLGDRSTAAAEALELQGLTQDGREILRRLRRMNLRAMLIEDCRSEKSKDVAIDWLVWSQLRIALRDPSASAETGIGAFAISAGWNEGMAEPQVAEPHLQETRAWALWSEAIAQLRAQSFMSSPNLGGAFIDFQHAAADIKRLAAAVVAGHSLKPSMNATGYRNDLHDTVANATLRSSPAAIRRLWHPTAAFLELVPKTLRLAIVQDMVDPKIFRTWAKLKAGEVTDMVLRVLTGRSPNLKAKGVQAAAEWVHPTLQFGRPDVLDRAAPTDDREAA